jgi:hypothetical protein
VKDNPKKKKPSLKEIIGKNVKKYREEKENKLQIRLRSCKQD